MSSLLVNNVVSSSSQISYSYLESKEIFGYTLDLNYTIRTEDIHFENNDGVLLVGRSAIRQAYKRKNITARIAGDEILNGLITSVSFPESSLSGSETVNVSIQEKRRLDDYSGKTFAKYIPNPHLIESFEETYNFNRSGSNYSYSRNISIQYSQDAGDQFLNNAKVFLTNYYFQNRPQIGYYEDGISENARFSKGYNGLLTESIDLIQLSVSLEESFESSFINGTSDISKLIKNSFSSDSEGYLSKKVVIDLVALRYNKSDLLQQGIQDAIDSVIAQESSEFGEPTSISKGITKDGNKSSITIDFSKNPNKSQGDVVTYRCEKRKEEAFVNYALTVNYKSKGKNTIDRYEKLLSSWNSSKDKNEPKVISLFSEANGVIHERSRSTNISKSNASISESIQYTTDESYKSGNLPEGILKYNISLQKTERTKRNLVVTDLLDLKQKLVTSDLLKLGQATVTATCVAPPSYGIFHGKDFLNSKTSDMNNALEESTYYATSDQISIDLSNGSTTRVIQYIIA